MTYENFSTYPIQILGINESYNNELTAIETLVKEEIEYSGEVADIESVLPYFVFFKFCENVQTKVDAKTGENITVSELTKPSYDAQIRAWNIGVKKLISICEEKTATASKYYTSKIGWL